MSYEFELNSGEVYPEAPKFEGKSPEPKDDLRDYVHKSLASFEAFKRSKIVFNNCIIGVVGLIGTAVFSSYFVWAGAIFAGVVSFWLAVSAVKANADMRYLDSTYLKK